MKEKTLLVVGGLFRKGESVLLIRQRKPDDPELKWALPGGYVEHGESVLDALRREVREETGLNLLRIGSLLYSVHLFIPVTGAAILVLVFQVDDWNGQLQPCDSLLDAEEAILDAQFVPVKDALQRLKQGFRFANEPAIEYLRGKSPRGSAWFYQGDPYEGDQLIERTLFGEGNVKRLR